MKCPVCGKEFFVTWPHLWAYRRGSRYLCRWGCLRYFDEKGSEEMYTKVKKDGTPAKKPGKKTAEQALKELKEDFAEKGVELICDPEIAEEYRREQAQKKANEKAKEKAVKRTGNILGMEPLETCAVRSRVRKDCSYTTNDDGEMYMSNGGMFLQFSAREWTAFSAEILLALEQLGVKEALPAELEGGENNWWYVCPECHGILDENDKKCPNCGQPISG